MTESCLKLVFVLLGLFQPCVPAVDQHMQSISGCVNKHKVRTAQSTVKPLQVESANSSAAKFLS